MTLNISITSSSSSNPQYSHKMTNPTVNHHSVLITSPKQNKPSLAHQSSFESHKHSKSTNCLAIPASPSSFHQQSPSNVSKEKSIGLSPSNTGASKRNSGLFSENLDVQVPSFNISPSPKESTPNNSNKLRTFSFHSTTTTSTTTTSATHLTIEPTSTKLPSLTSPKSPSTMAQSNAKHSMLKRNNSAHVVLMRDHSPIPIQTPKRQHTFASPSPTPSQTPSTYISPTNQQQSSHNQSHNSNNLALNSHSTLMPQDPFFSINRKVRSASHSPSTNPHIENSSAPSKESKGVLGPIDRSNMRVTFRRKAASKRDLNRPETPTQNHSPKKENGTVSFAEKFNIAVETQKQIDALTDYVKLDSYSFGLQNEEYKTTSMYDIKYDEEMYKSYIEQNQDMKTLFDVHNLVREYVSSRGSQPKKFFKDAKDSNKLVLDIIRRYNQKTLKKNKSEQTIKALIK